MSMSVFVVVGVVVGFVAGFVVCVRYCCGLRLLAMLVAIFWWCCLRFSLFL